MVRLAILDVERIPMKNLLLRHGGKTTKKIFRSFLRICLIIRRLFTGETFVFCESPWCGIGNRIKALANAYVGIGKTNIYYRWGLDDWVPESFETLFTMTEAPGFKVRSGKITEWYPLWFYPYPQRQRSNDTSFWRFWVPPAIAKGRWSDKQCHNDGFFYGKTEDNMLVDWHYSAIPASIRELYAPFFQQLQPSEAVRKRINDALQLMVQLHVQEREFIGVQIRNCANKGDVLRVCSVGSIIKCMESYPADQVFYLSCLEKSVSDRVHVKFPNRILELPSKNYRSMVDSVADMWMLGRGKELICSPRSTFNEVAWWWGGASCPVKMLTANVGKNGQMSNVY